ncbi:MAG: hypothetical protein ABJN95_05600 [Maribacter sp.]|uniref:hypothetical protein n=1 Tax=Maribacter sp. TaxID=1897614 RepID=UPI0032972E65
MNWKQKIPAGSLQFVLFIGVVILLLLLAFITLSYTHSFFGNKTDLFISTIRQADAGLNYMLQDELIQQDSIGLPTNPDRPISLNGIKEYWGVYEKYTVASTSKKNRFVKSVLVGKKALGQLPALYLQNKERPLIIVGKASITGDAFLPQQGIRTGNIAGNAFYGESTLGGNQRTSSAQLPKLDQNLRDHLELVSQNQFRAPSEMILPFSHAMSYSNSFKQPTQFIYGDRIDLVAVSLTGNLIIRASQKITVRSRSQLQDVILLAPEIEIKGKVKGTFQAIASKHISVGKGCLLGYPSALVTVTKGQSATPSTAEQRPAILVDSKTDVLGMIVYLGPSQGQQLLPQITVQDQVNLWGEIYCEQNLELKGNVFGSVTTQAFRAIEGGSIYQNHLFNGTINSAQLPQQYVGLLMSDASQSKGISKWLY